MGTGPLPPGTETYDVSSVWKREASSQRLLRTGGAVIGAAVLALGLYLFVANPLGSGHPNFDQRVTVPLALVVLGASFVAIGLGAFLFARELETIAMDDFSMRLAYTKGAEQTFRWDDPGLKGSLYHALRVPATDPDRTPGWVLSCRGSRGKAFVVITLEAGAALVEHARRKGLTVTTTRRENTHMGYISVFELIRFHRNLPADPTPR